MSHDPIIVTGAPRSGTTLTMQILAACGAFVGEVDSLYENVEVEEILKDTLRNAGFDPFGIDPLPKLHESLQIARPRERIQQVFLDQGYEDGPWAFKAIKGVFMMPSLHRAFPEAVWVYCWREPSASAKSWAELIDRPGTDFEKVVHYYHDRLARYHSYMPQLVAVQPVDFMDDYYKARQLMEASGLQRMEHLVEAVGLNWNPEAAEIPDRSLWHH